MAPPLISGARRSLARPANGAMMITTPWRMAPVVGRIFCVDAVKPQPPFKIAKNEGRQ